jgi:hypothetical protein
MGILENIFNYEEFQSLNEMMDGYKSGGMLLVFGKKLDGGERRLYATSIRSVISSPRTRVDSSPGSPAKMVSLNDDTFRIEMSPSGDISFLKISGRDKALGLTGKGIALNKNKTPYHWITTNYQSLGSMLNGMRDIIRSIPGVRWRN